MSKSNNSPTRKALRRFFRNIPAVIGIIIIFFSVVIALLGYQITPDHTANANDQILQIANKPIGFKVEILKRRKNKVVEKRNFFSKMMFGQENPYEMIPIDSYSLEDEGILIKEYTGDGFGIEKRFGLSDVVYNISQTHGNHLNSEELKKMIESEHIEIRKFYLGTDKFGRDLLSRLIIGVRISLSVGIVAVFISLIIGIAIGAVAGFFRGKVDEICMWFINVVWSIPTLLLVFAITLVLGKGFWQIFVAVGLTMWVEAARIIRGQILSLRELQYIEAAKSLGYSNFRTIRLHILPNVMGPLIVVAAANFASAILIEAGLSFLGIGVQPPMPSWGGMLSENYGYIIGANPFLALIPGIAIMLMVLAFNLVGNGLRDALDVKTSLQGNS